MNSGVSRTVTIGLGLAAVLVVGVLAVWGLTSVSPPDKPAGLTEIVEASELGSAVNLDRVGILTSTNFLGHRIYVVRGTLKNVSAMSLRSIDVKMNFVDYDGKTIHEEVHTAFDLKQRPLEPGTDYQFELNFENLPKTWNYRVPKVSVVKALY